MKIVVAVLLSAICLAGASQAHAGGILCWFLDQGNTQQCKEDAAEAYELKRAAEEEEYHRNQPRGLIRSGQGASKSESHEEFLQKAKAVGAPWPVIYSAEQGTCNRVEIEQLDQRVRTVNYDCGDRMPGSVDVTCNSNYDCISEDPMVRVSFSHNLKSLDIQIFDIYNDGRHTLYLDEGQP